MSGLFEFSAIGTIHSCFKEKFGVPRQAGLVPLARATIELHPPYDSDEAVRGMLGFSHVWVVFVFHQCIGQGWHPTVRPPRLGGNERMGVFASRAPYRPNPIGLSAVRLLEVSREQGRLLLHIEGGDFVDGTPVLDLKPYVPYADALDARDGYAAPPDVSLTVTFTDQALAETERRGKWLGVDLKSLITQVLQADPRPAYRKEDDDADYGMRLFDFDLRWRVEDERVTVLTLADTD